MIFSCKPTRVSIYVNTDRKTLAEIKEETGCTAIINGGLYTMATFSPVCHLKVDGKVLSSDKYTYLGLAWNDNDLTMTKNATKYENYITCVAMVWNGQPLSLTYGPELGGSRPRTALGVFGDGRVWLYAEKAGKTPEELRETALAAGVRHAIMLDGGGSTQGLSPTRTVTSARIVHNCICVWAEKDTEEEHDMFKIALDAGHGINTAGKRCMKSIDPNETREWWLNNRICDYIESRLKSYDGYELLRLDDSDDGREDVPLATRTDKANAWGATFYLSVHHNAGINGGAGGGIVAYTHPKSSKASVEWRDALYAALVRKTGLKGNRTSPCLTENYYVLRETDMPAVILELGFMDSTTDVPIILTDKYAQQCADAIVEVLVKRGGLKKKVTLSPPLYKVQVGAFFQLENAQKLQKELEGKGYDTYIVKA
mgnify:CR=1 FL=1